MRLGVVFLLLFFKWEHACGHKPAGTGLPIRLKRGPDFISSLDYLHQVLCLNLILWRHLIDLLYLKQSTSTINYLNYFKKSLFNCKYRFKLASSNERDTMFQSGFWVKCFSLKKFQIFRHSTLPSIAWKMSLRKLSCDFLYKTTVSARKISF